MKIKPLEEVRAGLLPVADGMGIEIVDVEFRQGRNPALTVFIDTEKGVDLDTCEKFHRAIDGVLDEIDPTYGESYTLNVSSPGLDRPLKTPRDFQRCMGERVEVRLYAPVRGRKFFEAELAGYDGNTLTLIGEEGEFKLEMSRVARINRAVSFDEE